MSTLSVPVARAFRPLLGKSRYKAAYGGRGSGKSHFFAEQVVLRAAFEPDCSVVCLRENQNSLDESVKRLLESKIRKLKLQGLFEVKKTEIVGVQSGNRIIFRGLKDYTAESIKSLEDYGIAWVEEAEYISSRSLTILTPTIRTPGSEIWFSWNPEKDGSPIDKFLRKSPPDNAQVVAVNYWDNPWFPEELRIEMERDKARDPERYQHVWCGGYDDRSETRVFRNWEVGELSPPLGTRWFFGVDWGFSVDPTAAARSCVIGDVLYTDYEAYAHECPMERLPALLHEIPDFAKWPSRGDSARPETIDFVRRHGFPKLARAQKGRGSVEDGIDKLRSYRWVVHPRCVHLINELKLYSYKVDRHSGEVLPAIEDAHNHVIDSVRYATEGLHRYSPVILQAKPAISRRRDYDDDENEGQSWKTM